MTTAHFAPPFSLISFILAFWISVGFFPGCFTSRNTALPFLTHRTSGTPDNWYGPPWIFIVHHPSAFAAPTIDATIADSLGMAKSVIPREVSRVKSLHKKTRGPKPPS